jgi:predicted GNAT superfamily acetyltransferase
MSEIEIRPLTSIDDAMQARRLQVQTWGESESETIPAHMFHALQHVGATLIGAFDGEQLVGFVLGVLGTVHTPKRIDQVAAARLRMYSAVLGVLPAYQSQGIGFQLKLAQREAALRQGLRLITWLYDPLESLNARFNIGKLGAICNQYHRHFHGDMSGINQGIPTDRFDVEWWVTSNRVQGRVVRQRRPLTLNALLDAGAVLVNETSRDADGLPVPPPDFMPHTGPLHLVEIPANFQTIKRQNMPLAQQWRDHTRAVFETMFAHHYLVTDFVYQQEPNGQARSFYLLTHQDS